MFGGGTSLSCLHNPFWKGFLCILGDVEDAESERIRSKVSIVEAGSWRGKDLLVDTRGFGHCRAVLVGLPLQCHFELSDSACGMVDWDSGAPFNKGPELQSWGYHSTQPA